MEFSQTRVLEWIAFPFSRDLTNPGVKPGSPTLRAGSLPSEPPGKPIYEYMWGKTCLIKHNLWHCILAWDCFYHAQVTLHQQTDVVLFLSRNFCLPVGQGACKREEKKREKENSLSKNIKSNIHTHTRTHNPTNQHLHNLPKVCKKLFSILRIWRKLQNRKYNLEEKLCSFTQNIFFMYQVLLVENESLPSKKLIA